MGEGWATPFDAPDWGRNPRGAPSQYVECPDVADGLDSRGCMPRSGGLVSVGFNPRRVRFFAGTLGLSGLR